MNYFLRLALVGVVFAGLACGSASAQTRIATVSLRTVFEKYWKTRQADAALKDRAADLEKQHKDLVEDYKKSRETYQGLLSAANDQALSAEERDKRKKSAEEKLKQIKDAEDTITQFERTARTTIDEQRNRMRDNLVEEIRNVLNAKAKSSNFSMVLDSTAMSATGTPLVLFTNNENDLTDSLLAQLNAAAPAETPKPEEKKDTKKDDKK